MRKNFLKREVRKDMDSGWFGECKGRKWPPDNISWSPSSEQGNFPHSGQRNRGRTLRNLPPTDPASQLCLLWFILNPAFIAQFRFVLFRTYNITEFQIPYFLAPGMESPFLPLWCHSPPGGKEDVPLLNGNTSLCFCGFPSFLFLQSGR